MNPIFNTEQFIKKKIVHRKESLLKNDVEKFYHHLNNEIENKSVLVIGGAGTIGSAFIKSLLPFNPKKLIVVDVSENGLT